MGTKLDDESLRIALGLRLGVPIVAEHACICGAVVNVFGSHGLSCKRSGGRIPRHAAVNETVRHALVSEGVPAVLEPMGVCTPSNVSTSRGASRLANSAELAKQNIPA